LGNLTLCQNCYEEYIQPYHNEKINRYRAGFHSGIAHAYRVFKHHFESDLTHDMSYFLTARIEGGETASHDILKEIKPKENENEKNASNVVSVDNVRRRVCGTGVLSGLPQG
jgi:hypothetical protein